MNGRSIQLNRTNRYRKLTSTDKSDGFTLLEMLIVGVLVSVLMLGVWSLFRTWGGLYERGEERTMRAQLMRSLCDRFTDDVRGATYVSSPSGQSPKPVSPQEFSTTSDQDSSRRGNLALVGGSTWLLLEVLQAPSPFHQAGQDGESTTDMEGAASLYAPELQYVAYSFALPEDDLAAGFSPALSERIDEDDTELVGGEESDDAPFSGLLRAAIAAECFEAMASADTGSDSLRDQSTGVRQMVVQLRESLTSSVERSSYTNGGGMERGSQATEDAQFGLVERDEIPEVTWFEFRYYDGSSWLSSWDSRSQGQIPTAIEMRFMLREAETGKSVELSGEETELVDDTSSWTNDESADLLPPSDDFSVNDTTDDLANENTETPYFRCVVFLGRATERGVPR